MSKSYDDTADAVVGQIVPDEGTGLDQVGYGFPAGLFGHDVKRTTCIRLPRVLGNVSDPITINVESTMKPSQDTHTEVTVDGDIQNEEDLDAVVHIVASLFRA